MDSAHAGAPTKAVATIHCGDASTTATSTMAKQKTKKRTIDSTSMAPLLIVKPVEYEDVLQAYFNTHTSIGDAKLLQVLEESRNATCSKKTMRTWLDHHEPITMEPSITDYDDFLLRQLAAKPSIGSKAMCTAVLKARGSLSKKLLSGHGSRHTKVHCLCQSPRRLRLRRRRLLVGNGGGGAGKPGMVGIFGIIVGVAAGIFIAHVFLRVGNSLDGAGVRGGVEGFFVQALEGG